MNTKGTAILIVIVALGIFTKGIEKETGRLENKWTSGGYPNYSIIKIGQNTEKSPGDLRRLAVSLTPLEDHQLTLL